MPSAPGDPPVTATRAQIRYHRWRYKNPVSSLLKDARKRAKGSGLQFPLEASNLACRRCARVAADP